MAEVKQRKSGSGGIFPALAIVLFLVTVIGLFLDLNPAKELHYAWEETRETLTEEEEAVLFLKDCLTLGEVKADSGKESISYSARLPEEARLSFGGEGYSAALTAKEDRLVFSSEVLSDEARYGDRSGAAAAFFDSAYADAEVLPEEIKMLTGLYLALTDPDFVGAPSTLGETANALWDIADVSPKKESAVLSVGEEEIDVKDIVYSFRAEELKKMWTLFASEGKKESFQDAVCSLYAAMEAFGGKPLTREKEEAIRAFCRGEGERFHSVSRVFLSESSEGSLSFHIYKGRVIGIGLSLKSGDVKVNGEIFFGKKVAGAEERTLSFAVQSGEESLFSALLAARVTENSDRAFVREWTWEISDAENILLSGEKAASGKIRYSWGKEKKDLGLRFVTEAGEVTFGGTLSEYKKGKKCEFVLGRLEVDRVNLLQGESFTVTATPGSDGILLPDATGALFPAEEEKASLAASFAEKYRGAVKK